MTEETKQDNIDIIQLTKALKAQGARSFTFRDFSIEFFAPVMEYDSEPVKEMTEEEILNYSAE